MTLSPKTQRAERQEVLRGMFEKIGEGAYLEWVFQAEADFPGIHASTWKALEDDGYVTSKHTYGEARYQLTAQGWLAALREVRPDAADLQQRCQQLMQLLKKLIDKAESPHHDQLFDWRYDVPADAGLSPGWVFNALSSSLLREEFPNHRINHYPDSHTPNRLFRIPSNFGRKLVDLTEDYD